MKGPQYSAQLILLAALLTLFGATRGYAYSDAFNAWHNGSKVRVSIAGNQFVITYIKPRHTLERHGVHNGTILFSGTIDGQNVEGQAHTFRINCEPVSYWVSGRYRDNRSQFTFRGDAPRRESNGGCDVVGYTGNGSNANLHFKKIAGE